MLLLPLSPPLPSPLLYSLCPSLLIGLPLLPLPTPSSPTTSSRLRITHLEEKLSQREKDFQVQELQMRLLRQELDAKTTQVEKLQDAIGCYSHTNGHLAGTLPPPQPPPLPLASVIDQGSSSRFHRVAVEVHRRLKAKEGVSAEPTSGAYSGGGGGGRLGVSAAERAVVRKDSK